jgi:hypothetical protein
VGMGRRARVSKRGHHHEVEHKHTPVPHMLVVQPAFCIPNAASAPVATQLCQGHCLHWPKVSDLQWVLHVIVGF